MPVPMKEFPPPDDTLPRATPPGGKEPPRASSPVPRMQPRTRPEPVRTALLPALLALAGCASTAAEEPADVEDLIDHGRYAEAVELAADLRDRDPGDVRAVEVHRRASVAFLLEQGRRLTFEDRDVDALHSFAQALEIAPDSPAVVAWVQKTRLKLAERWLETALEMHANDQLEGAVDAYEQALAFSPGDPSAVTGMATAIVQLNHREGLGKRYFEEGVHALADYWLEQARSRFSYAGKYQPEDQRTGARREQVDRLLAAQRVAVAGQFEAEGRWSAAYNEHRLALALDPDNADAKAGLERTKVEARAARLIEETRMEIVRGRFEQAQQHLEEGAALSERQQDLFEGLRAELENARNDRLYSEALAYELGGDFEAAIERYAALLERTPYFKDVLTRKDTLEEYVSDAGELYARAEAAADPAEQLALLRQIAVFWPEYRDVRERLAALEAVEAR